MTHQNKECGNCKKDHKGKTCCDLPGAESICSESIHSLRDMIQPNGENPTKQHTQKCPKLYGKGCICNTPSPKMMDILPEPKDLPENQDDSPPLPKESGHKLLEGLATALDFPVPSPKWDHKMTGSERSEHGIFTGTPSNDNDWGDDEPSPKSTHTNGENPTKQHAMKCPKLYGQECTCDGFHTFEELYEHRFTLFITLCRTFDRIPDYIRDVFSPTVWRSKLHADGTMYDGWFVIGIGREKGEQISYHLPLARWDETDFAETLPNAPEYDGHTSDDVLERLRKL